MLSNIEKLSKIAGKESRYIIGLMSGTSFDGLDIALCRFEGAGTDTRFTLLHFKTVEYDDTFRQELKSIFAKEQVSLLQVTLLHAYIGKVFAEMILQCLDEWNVPPSSVDLVASHGQTIFHAPASGHGRERYTNATLQIGDADHIAVGTGIITVSDFRQKHIAAGGEGAPLAIYGDYLLLSDDSENRILLNIGGIANFTYLPSDRDASKVFSTDAGPGNTLMDQFMQLSYPGKYYDDGALTASSGSVNALFLRELMNHPFFRQGFPKTTGPELFNLSYVDAAKEKAGIAWISPEDVMATLNAFASEGIAAAIETCFSGISATIYLSGGGMHNPLLIENLKRRLPGFDLKRTSAIGLDPDAKEAVLFALLANECLGGRQRYFDGNRDVPSVSMGKISFPD